VKPKNTNKITVPGSTVDALRTYWEMQLAAEIGRKRRKIAQKLREGVPAQPVAMLREERVRHYANQTGWTSDFTPAQRRRLEKKSRRANSGYHVVDEVRA